MGSQPHSPPHEAASPMDGGVRKRVCKACDRCRLKKSKCDGASPCSRCRVDNAICVFGERKKSHDKVYPKGYVEMLESQQAQLVAGLQEMYKRLQNGTGWTGTPLKESSSGQPLTHDILERLGALKVEGATSPESFEENLNVLQQKLNAHQSGSTPQEPSSDNLSDSDQSPIYDTPNMTAPTFSNPFAVNSFPPTPPNQSPFPRMVHPREVQSGTYANTGFGQSNLKWESSMMDLNEVMDLSIPYDTDFDLGTTEAMMFSPTVFQEHQMSGIAINPVMTMKDWAGQDGQRYFSPTMI